MKLIIVLGIILLALAGCQDKVEKYVIKGELEGAPENDWVFLTDIDQDIYYDSVQLKKGHFEFKGKVASPELRCVTYFKDPSQRIYGWDKILMIPVYVENSEIQFSLPFSDMPSKLDRELPKSLRVEGSHAHDLYAMYRERVTPFVLKNDSLFNAYGSAYYYKRGTEEDVFRCVRGMDAMRDSIFNVGIEFVQRHTNSPVALYVAKNLKVRAYERKRAEQVVDILPEAVRATPDGQKTVKALLEQPLYVGDVLPDFEVLNTDLDTVKLSGLLEKGHYTLVELWASWCGPCRSDIPHLKETYQRYHEKGFDIISISIDDDMNAWVKAVKDENMAWTQVCGAKGNSFDKECMNLFGVRGVPSCVLVDKEGKVVSTYARGGWLNEKLVDLFQERK